MAIRRLSQNMVEGLSESLAGKQAANSNLTAIAALSTQTYGRSLLSMPDVKAARAVITSGDSGVIVLDFSGGDITPSNLATFVDKSVGFYKVAGDAMGIPVAFPTGWPSTHGVLEGYFANHNAYQYSWQRLTGTSGNRVWMRKATSAYTWSPWTEIYHTGNVVGAVSSTGSDNTGAIIETGSNANGMYTKFADGTLICSRSLELTGLTWTTVGPASYTQTVSLGAYAHEFAALPALTVFGCDDGAASTPFQMVYHSYFAAGQIAMFKFSSAGGSNTSGTISYFAIGRWK